MRRTTALIVGGGPAGAAAAIGLARAGIAALLVERDAETRDALCGGFLSWATIERLQRLGVDPLLLGAHRIDRLAVHAGKRTAETALPAPAAALSRQTLDMALLNRANAFGVAITRGSAVKSLEGNEAKLDDGEMVADHLILATGKHDVRGVARGKRTKDPAIGLRWRLASSPALGELIDHRIELHLFEGGYAGLVRQEDSANLCLAVRRSVLTRYAGRPQLLLEALAADHPVLRARLDAAHAIGPPQAIANVPYGWQAQADEGGLYRVGDQAGVIPSLAGEGIAIAVASGAAAAEAIVQGRSSHEFQAGLAKAFRRPISIASLLWHLAERPTGAHMIVQATRFAPTLTRLLAHLTRV